MLILLLLLLLHPLSAEEQRTYTENGALSSIEEDGRVERYSYDERGRLSQILVMKDGKLEGISSYAYDNVDDHLLRAEEAGTRRYFSQQGFSVSDGSRFQTLGGGFFLNSRGEGQAGLSMNAEGRLERTRRIGDTTITETFDGQGHILSSARTIGEEQSENHSYAYDAEGRLSTESILASDGGRTDRIYRNGVLVQETKYDRKGVVLNETTFVPRKQKTVYDKGMPYARVTYTEDGKQVEEVAYL